MRFNKLAAFTATSAGAYAGLYFLGYGAQAWEVLRTGANQNLQLLLSGGIGGIFALLMPSKASAAPEDRPHRPDLDNHSAVPKVANPGEPSVPKAQYDEVGKLLAEWVAYGEKAKDYMMAKESEVRLLDLKQVILRTSLYGIIGLAFLSCIAGFLAPSIATQPGAAVSATALLQHFGVLLGAFGVGGFVLGVIVYRLKQPTTPYHAWRGALIASSIVSVGSLLTSLPYVFARMWSQQIMVGSITMPMLVWMGLFRVVVSPCVTACSGWLGFQFAKLLSKQPANN